MGLELEKVSKATAWPGSSSIQGTSKPVFSALEDGGEGKLC